MEHSELRLEFTGDISADIFIKRSISLVEPSDNTLPQQQPPPASTNMWSGGSDLSAYGEAVLLYEPVGGGGGGDGGGGGRREGKSKSASASASHPLSDPATSSAVGGCPSYYPGDGEAVRRAMSIEYKGGGDVRPSGENPPCGLCRRPTVLIAQVYAPLEDRSLDRTLYVFGCNQSGCYSTLFRSAAASAAAAREEEGGCDEGGGRGEKDKARWDENEARARRFHIAIAPSASYDDGGAFRSPVMCVRSQRPRSEGGVTDDAGSDAAAVAACADVGKSGGDIGGDWGDEDAGDWGADNAVVNADDGGWGDGDAGGAAGYDRADDWGASAGDNGGAGTSVEDLEAMLTKCELNADDGAGTNAKKKKKAKGKKKKTLPSDGAASYTGEGDDAHGKECLRRLEIDYYEEPWGRGAGREDEDDDDDDEVGACSESDDTVRRMLSRYLEEEDDEEILAAVRSGGGGSGCTAGTVGSGGGRGGSSGGGEKYERLPPEERAMLRFADRMRRAPRQVVRYAYGGVPMWSIPTPSPPGKSKRKKKGASAGKGGRRQKESGAPSKSSSEGWVFPSVPRCRCGADRSFELQLMPPLLLALNVDSVAVPSPLSAENGVKRRCDALERKGPKAGEPGETAARGGHGTEDVYESGGGGGMNWGTLAVYCCSDSCEGNRGEIVVVQADASDGVARRRMVAMDPCGEGGHDDNDEAHEKEGFAKED